MKKKYYLVALLLMLVCFAAVSTTLYLSGSTNIIGNKDDFKVYYSDAKVNGVQDLSIVESETSLVFSTELDTLGQTYVIEYDVTNSSKNYDADLTMVCTGGDEYLTVNNVFDDTTNLPATETRVGTLTLTLSKTYTGADYDVDIECTITANAVERTSLAEEIINFTIDGKQYSVVEGTTWKTWLDSSDNDVNLVYDEGYEYIYVWYDGISGMMGHLPELLYNPNNVEIIDQNACSQYGNNGVVSANVSDPIIKNGIYSTGVIVCIGGGADA